MIKFYLFEIFALYSLNFFAPALSSPVAQSGAPSGPFPDTNSYSPIPPDSNIPAGYQMGMATVSISSNIPRRYVLARIPWLTSAIAMNSKTGNPLANKASAPPTASSPTHSPAPLAPIHYLRASLLLPLALR